MTSPFECETNLLRGPLVRQAGGLPLALLVRWCDLRPRLIAKGRAGRGYRAVARNGRVLLASDVPLTDLPGRVTRLRIQTWHKVILSGEAPESYGVLLCVRGEDAFAESSIHSASLEAPTEGDYELTLEVGGGLAIRFRKSATASEVNGLSGAAG
jgi:hypothetical protein